MRTKNYRKAAAASLGGVAMASSAMAFAADWDGSYSRQSDGDGSLQAKIELLRQKVKYVFVIFHENESFDDYFGTYPGANGLFEAPGGFTPANQTPSFTQRYLDTSLAVKTISPFLMPQAVIAAGTGKVTPIYPADEISVDHSHQGMANDLDVNPTTGIAANDRYAMDQEGLTTNASGAIVTSTGAAPTSISLAQKQKAEDDIDHLDCDTIPFMWSWAKHFVLFDNFHQTVVGPSTPNAIAIIAGQSGETQWALHPDEGAAVTYANKNSPNPLGASYGSKITPSVSNAYVPIVANPGPFAGSNLDTNAVKPPYNPSDESPTNPTLNLTFATQPLSFMGYDIDRIIKNDPNPAADLRDVQGDIREIASFNRPVKWGWYQQGFNANDVLDPYEPPGSPTAPTSTPGTSSTPLKDGRCRRTAYSICAAAMTTTTGSFQWIQLLRSRTRSSAMMITRPTRISRSPKPSRRRRSATSPAARIGGRAPSSSLMMRRTATTITSCRRSAARLLTARSWRRARASRRS
jgi:Phosphoesterase family